MPVKLCVCGRSAAYPICDNSHEDELWSCAQGPAQARVGFGASGPYINLARKLAAAYEGLCLTGDGEPGELLELLVLIVDGAHLEAPMALRAQVRAEQVVVVSLTKGAALLADVFEGATVHDLHAEDPRLVFKRVQLLLDGALGDEPPAVGGRRTLFLSHAVRDEPLVIPAVAHLKQWYGADIFTCADSIPPGSRWHDEIMDALRSQDIFVSLLSKHFLASGFAAFEMGCAYALDKPMAAISLDGSAPPAFVQHLQMADIPRLRRVKPWLETGDVLIDELMSLVSTES